MCQVKVGRLLPNRADRRKRVSKGLSPLAMDARASSPCRGSKRGEQPLRERKRSVLLTALNNIADKDNTKAEKPPP